MQESIALLRDRLDDLRKNLRESPARVVNQKAIREQTREIVKYYFSTFRPSLVEQRCDEEELLESLDLEMQQLLTHCNARTLRKKYFGSLKNVKKELNQLEAVCLTANLPTSDIGTEVIERQDRDIIRTLKSVCPSAADSFQQGISDLLNEERLSWRGTVAEFRESLRQTVDELAPDDDVEAQQGFKLEKDCKGPTMKQKVVFIFKNRRASSNEINMVKSNVDIIDEKAGAFVRSVYGRSSSLTHGASSREECVSLKRYVALILSELLQVQ